MTISLEDKLILITGATSGIGEATAIELSKFNPTLILLGKNSKKGEKVSEKIRKISENKKIDFFNVNLSSQTEIRNFAKKYNEKYDRLDILINNAGINAFRRQITEDGIERIFAVNHLAYFLLTNLLLDTIRKNPPVKIINVSSGAHWGSTINFEDINYKKTRFNGWKVYGQSKLANIMFTYSLAERLKDTGVTVNCLHPGQVRTNIVKLYGLGKFWRYNPFNFSATESALNGPVFLAMSKKVENVTGKYFYDKKERRTSPISKNKEVQEKLWKMCEQMTELKNN
ncbi:MAG: 3-oxoacyl-[acyl-carrier-protein] reductase FabG [Candidatus Heimdallarchaeota archaeon LC_3]|nr:MAG: 3-oxoacyl-[acyl-carrier-protein] reductase FabG [Candidatus Heimdallarchaeota archaeon LC_3]